MRKIFLAFILSFFAITTFAQQNFRLGLTTTPTIGWIKSSDKTQMYSNGSAFGFTYGLIGDFNFANNYAFSTALQITTINGNATQIYNVNGADSKAEVRYKMSYLEIPLAIKLKTEPVGDIAWYGKFGLSNGFKLSAKRDVTLNNQNIENDQNINSVTSLYRAGLIIGGGGEYHVSERSILTFGLTFNNGFTNFYSENGYKAQNHYFAIDLGMFF